MVLAAATALLLGGCALILGRLEPDVVFTRYSSLSRSEEVARRTLPPITYHRIQQTLAAKQLALDEQSIDLAKEKFDIYVPRDGPPPEGYGLIVFVAPWPEATRPQRWCGALDANRLIFVSAQNSGNDAPILERRLPLALLAYENVRARYPINPERVYVTGMSGGSRVAEIAALAYPEIFRGAVLNAGSDPIDGKFGIYKPPADLFHTFQRSRIVFITGSEDSSNLSQDDATRESLKDSCVFDVKTEFAMRLGHEPLNSVSLFKALDALAEPRAVDAAELARCNARLDRALADKLAEVAAKIARGDRRGARSELTAIDAEFGGLAAPAIIDLDDQLAAEK
jgi:pimeloyl-ACP methyl ester carboxylesterase